MPMLAISQYQLHFLDYLQKQEIGRQPRNLYDPIDYILGLGGKRMRPVLTLMAAEIFDCHFEKALPAAMAVEVFHNFSPGGFTGVVCLSESHLSVHTWPEYGKVNLDIYLSNFERENDGTVKEIYAALCQYFGGEIVHEEMIRR